MAKYFLVVAASTVSSLVVASTVTTRRVVGRQMRSSASMTRRFDDCRLGTRACCFQHSSTLLDGKVRPLSSSFGHSLPCRTAKRLDGSSNFYATVSSSLPNLNSAGSSLESSCPSRQKLLVQEDPQEAHEEGNEGRLFLDEVEETIENVFQDLMQRFPDAAPDDALAVLPQLPPAERETLAVASRLRNRLNAMKRNGDCRRCWFPASHCICPSLYRSLEPEDHYSSPSSSGRLPMGRLFLLLHHKEVGLAVDTAKLLLASFPRRARLVVSGIGPQYQSSMAELLQALQNPKCLCLFPTDEAQTFEEFLASRNKDVGDPPVERQPPPTWDDGWDVIAIDGTWSQARKMHDRYIPPQNQKGPCRIKLAEDALWSLLGAPTTTSSKNGLENAAFVKQRIRKGQRRSLTPRSDGFQLRRHAVKWREISTSEATRLLLQDMALSSWNDTSAPPPWWISALYRHQEIANQAAKRQLGPPRLGKKHAKQETNNPMS